MIFDDDGKPENSPFDYFAKAFNGLVRNSGSAQGRNAQGFKPRGGFARPTARQGQARGTRISLNGFAGCNCNGSRKK